MASYLASYIPAIKSIIPQASPSVASLPEIGDAAPAPVGSIDLSHGNGRPTLVAFVRHCGCPFAEKEVQLLGAESRKNEKLHVVIVQHSDEATTKQWFEDVGGKKAFSDSNRYTLVSDPERKIYAAWGVGALGWTGMVNGGIMDALKSLKESDGIDLRPTGAGSYRWQNSGGFAVDGDGKIRWKKIAKDSSDVCDYAAAAKTVVNAVHAEALFPLIGGPSNASLWDYMPYDPFPASVSALHTDMVSKASSNDPVFYTILKHEGAEKVPVGWCSYLRIDAKNRVIEVGHLMFSAKLQRSVAATEAMYLMAKYAFEGMGYRRFVEEGTFRQALIDKHGRNRDTTWFSMLDSEWEGIKKAFESWLDESNFDAEGKQKKKLEEFRA
ncbi:hypothetical protein E4T39_06841 [Aureobasidium subglaciale]|nr:hypothetical protein E4T39_06841 [Aureobasidium subglaciale]